MEENKKQELREAEYIASLAPVFDLPMVDIITNPPQNAHSESVQNAEKFFYFFIESIKEHIGEQDGEKARAILEKLPFSHIVGLYGQIADKVEAQSSPQIIKEFIFAIDTPAPEKEADPLPLLRSIIPKTAVINNSKLAQNITRDFVGAGEIELNTGTPKKPLTVVASLAYDDETLSITGRHPFTAYDRTVYNGICSLFQAGNKLFTPSMVYRAMNGIQDSKYISPQAVGAVTRSIEKLRVTKLTIDCTEQLKAYPKLKQQFLDDMLVSAKKIRAINHNGEELETYIFNSAPILYDYSRSIGQVISVLPRLLNTSKILNTTDEVIVLREYLIRRIEGMRAKNNLYSDRIEFAAIYAELGLERQAVTKDKAWKLRNNTEKILTHLKAERAIKEFQEYKKGRTVAGVEITL